MCEAHGDAHINSYDWMNIRYNKLPFKLVYEYEYIYTQYNML
jgi:hypothetical protein